MGNYRDEQELIENNNLPSERWKVRRIRTARDRELRRLKREYDQVCEIICNLGYEEVNPPVQLGYKRLFVLTEETKYGNKAEFYQNILDKINTIWYSPVKTFKKDRKRRIAKWSYRKRQEQTLCEPGEYYFCKNEHFTEEEAKLFTLVEYYNDGLKRWCVKYVFNEPWRFVLRVRPNLITQKARRDFQLEQYRDELSDRIDQSRSRINKILHGGNTNSWRTMEKKCIIKEKYKDYSLRNKPIHEIMEVYKEEKQLWE